MAIREYHFCGVAIETTGHWNWPEDSTLRDCRAYTIGLMRIGEATHVCSFEPSTYVVDMSNEFANRDGSPLTDEQREEIETHELFLEGLDHDYHGYMGDAPTGPRFSEPFTIELDDADFEGSTDDHEPDAMHKEAWNEAIEYASGNGAAIEPPLIGMSDVEIAAAKATA